MSFNGVENLFLEMAIRQLEKQLIELGEWPEDKRGKFYLGYPNYPLMLTDDKRLTIGVYNKRGELEPRPDINPVNCYNFYRPMSLGEAVIEWIDRQKNPDKYTIPFFI